MQAQLSSSHSYKELYKQAEQLDNVNTDNINPLTHIHEHENIYRKDVVIQKEIKNAILNLAPNKNSDYFKVPKVLKNNT